MVLDARAQALVDREEAAHREVVAAAAVKDWTAVAEQQTRDRVKVAVLDTASKVKVAQTPLDSELREAARRVTDAEAAATDATARATAAEENAPTWRWRRRRPLASTRRRARPWPGGSFAGLLMECALWRAALRRSGS